jgi:chromosomal replication initiation ATPase DnaA
MTRKLMPEIVKEVARRHHLRPEDITGKSRARVDVLARHEFMFLAMDGTRSYFQVAAFLKCDRTTVYNGRNRHAERMANALGVAA